MKLASLVIVTKDEAAVARTLDAVRTLPEFGQLEVIVVDGSARTDHGLLRRNGDVRWIDFESAPGAVTIAAQRNLGVQAARSEIIVFTDAGCVPDRDWLAQLLAPILDGREEMAAGLTLSTSRSIYDDPTAESEYLRECPTINVAFTRSLYARVGGFDESFEYGSDVDFSWRVNDAGCRILRVPRAVVYADWGNARRRLRRSYRYGRARARLYTKHRDRWGDLWRHDVTAVLYPAFILGLPVMIALPAYPLLLLVPLVKNRHMQPFSTVIDHLAYGCGVLRQIAAAASSAP
jgi:glycosyltransferase involved in cell wall biosynthesis